MIFSQQNLQQIIRLRELAVTHRALEVDLQSGKVGLDEIRTKENAMRTWLVNSTCQAILEFDDKIIAAREQFSRLEFQRSCRRDAVARVETAVAVNRGLLTREGQEVSILLRDLIRKNSGDPTGTHHRELIGETLADKADTLIGLCVKHGADLVGRNQGAFA